jgi:hypothetical protein
MSVNESDDTNVSRLLAGLRDAESRITAPAHVEAALLQAWDRSHAAPIAGTGSIASGWLGLAAAAVLAVGLTTLGERLRTETATVAGAAEADPGAVVFVGAPILDDEPVRLVRMRMPVSVLRSLGVRSTAGDRDAINVDVVVGEDGVARALRVRK